jgi:hypothetical protein
MPAQRRCIPLKCRQPNVGRARLQTGHRGLRRAHARSDLGLGQTELLSTYHETRDKLSPPAGHLAESREYRPVARSSAPRSLRTLHIVKGISKQV